MVLTSPSRSIRGHITLYSDPPPSQAWLWPDVPFRIVIQSDTEAIRNDYYVTRPVGLLSATTVLSISKKETQVCVPHFPAAHQNQRMFFFGISFTSGGGCSFIVTL